MLMVRKVLFFESIKRPAWLATLRVYEQAFVLDWDFGYHDQYLLNI